MDETSVNLVLEVLSRNGLTVVPTGDFTYAGSLCMTLLQHLTRNYKIVGSFHDLCLLSTRKKDWDNLTSIFNDRQQELSGQHAPATDAATDAVTFTQSMIQIYHCAEDSDSKRASIIALFAFSLHETVEYVESILFNPATVLLLNDVFSPIVPQTEYYAEPESFLEGLKTNFVELQHAQKFAHQFLRQSDDILVVIAAAVKIEKDLKDCTTFEELYAIVQAADIHDHLYLISRMCAIVRNCVDSGDHELIEVKLDVVRRLQDELRKLLATRRDQATCDVQRIQALMEVNDGIEDMKIRLREEIDRLDGTLTETERIYVENRINHLKEEGAWLQIRTCLSKTLSSQKFTTTPLLSFADLFTSLLIAGHVINLDTAFFHTHLFRNLEPKSHELIQILNEKFNFRTDAVPGTRCYKFSGAVIFLSDVIERIERIQNIHSSTTFHLQISATEIVYLDVDFPTTIGNSKNLSIDGKRVKVLLPQNALQVSIDLSGDNGPELAYRRSTNKTAANCDGFDGLKGNDGKSSGNLTITSYEKFEGAEYLGVKCNGGSGSRGEDGDNGGDGVNGQQGNTGILPDESPSDSLILIRHGRDGQNGTKGGNGGTGRLGGKGGSKGVINIYSEGSLVSTPGFQAENGVSGDSGEPGKPGLPGKGGARGKDNAWYRECWGLVFHSWLRADTDPKWKKEFAQKATTLHLEEADCSTIFRKGYTVKKVEGRAGDGIGQNAPPTNHTPKMNATQQLANPIEPFTQAAIDAQNTTESLPMQLQSAQSQLMLYTRELDNLRNRKITAENDIRLFHQARVNMMETVEVTSGTPFLYPFQVPDNATATDSPLTELDDGTVPGRFIADPNLRTWCDSIEIQLPTQASSPLTSVVQLLLATSFRKWGTIQPALTEFIQNLSYRRRFSDAELLQLQSMIPRHFEMITEPEVTLLINWYDSNILESKSLPIDLELDDIGQGAMLRDVIFWNWKRNTVASYKQRAPEVLQAATAKHGQLLGGRFKTVKKMVTELKTFGKSLIGYSDSKGEQAALALSTEMYETTMTQMMPVLRQLVNLEPKSNRKSMLSAYFKTISESNLDGKGTKEIVSNLLTEITGMTCDQVIVTVVKLASSSVTKAQFFLKNLNFTAGELQQVVWVLEEDPDIGFCELEVSFVSSLFLDPFTESMERLRLRQTSSKLQFDSMAKILCSFKSHLDFEQRIRFYENLTNSRHNLSGGHLLSEILKVMRNTYNMDAEGFEFITTADVTVDAATIIQEVLDSATRVLDWEDCDLFNCSRVLDIASMELEIHSFTTTELETIETRINRFELTLCRRVEAIHKAMPNFDLDQHSLHVFNAMSTFFIMHSYDGSASFKSLTHSVILNAVQVINTLRTSQDRMETLKTLGNKLEHFRDDSLSGWESRADFLTVVLQVMKLVFHIRSDLRKVKSKYRQLLLCWQLRIGVFGLRQALYGSWAKAARELEAKLNMHSLKEITGDIETSCGCSKSDSEQDPDPGLRLMLKRISYLGVTQDQGKLYEHFHTFRNSLVPTNSRQENRSQLKSLLQSLHAEYLMREADDTELQSLGLSGEDFDSWVNVLVAINNEAEISSETIYSVKRFLVLRFDLNLNIQRSSVIRLVQMEAKTEELIAIKRILMAFRATPKNTTTLEWMLDDELQLRAETSKKVHTFVGIVARDVLGDLMHLERPITALTTEHNYHAKLLRIVEHHRERGIGLVQHSMAKMVEVAVLNAMKTDVLESEDWLSNLVDTLLQHWRLEDMERMRMLLSIPSMTTLKVLLWKGLNAAETKRNVTEFHRLLSYFEDALIARSTWVTDSIEGQEALTKVTGGLKFIQIDSSVSILRLKITIWRTLVDRIELAGYTESELSALIKPLLMDYIESRNGFKILGLIGLSLADRRLKVDQVGLAALYFDADVTKPFRHLLGRFTKVIIQGRITKERLSNKTYFVQALTEKEALLFHKIPIEEQDLMIKRLVDEEPKQWLKILECWRLGQIQADVWGNVMPVDVKRRLGEIQTLQCRHKFGGDGPLCKLLTDGIIPLLALDPLPTSEFVNFFETASSLKFDEVEGIVFSYLPNHWLAQCLLKHVLNAVHVHYSSNNSSSCKEIADNLKSLVAILHHPVQKLRLIEILSHFKLLLEPRPLAKASFLASFFVQVVQLARGGEIDDGFVTELNHCRCTTDWKWVLRNIFYKRTFPQLTAKQLRQAVAMEMKIGSESQAELFLKLVVLRLETDRLTFDMCENHIANGYWVVDSNVLSEIDRYPGTTIQDHFRIYQEKAVELTGSALIEEFFKRLNKNEAVLPGTQLELTRDELLEQLETVKQKYQSRSLICLTIPYKIGRYTRDDIGTWVTALRETLKQDSDAYSNLKLEIMAVTMRGIEIHVGNNYKPRDTQILTVLLCLRGFEEERSQFGQIATGEGKTDISAMFALHLALCNKNVDILSSGASLAVEAARAMKGYYDMFGISSGEISSPNCRKGKKWDKELKCRYKYFILYGTIRCFQADYLYNRYRGMDYMGKREPHCVIVDEVDSLTLDKGSQVLFISYKIPELRYLRPCFIETWAQVVTQVGIDENEVERRLKEKIEAGELKIPTGLEGFVQKRLKTWIQNAIAAKAMEDGEFYLSDSVDAEDAVRTDLVVMDVPTGEAQLNSQYSLGIQQFLQLRHGKKMSPESLKEIFISNHAYLKKFKNCLFGITGTLGSQRSRQFLNKHYGAQFFEMPPHKRRRCTVVPATLAENEAIFNVAVMNSIVSRIQFQPILLLCQTVRVAKRLINYLQTEITAMEPEQRPRLLPYLTSQNVKEFEQEFGKTQENPNGRPVCPNTIIVATNLGGRGTDLKIECPAGLHVILTHIPGNKRIRNQAFGRTSRSGKAGSSEYIVILPRLNVNTVLTIKDYEKLFFDQEDARIDGLDNIEIPKNELEGALFEEFELRLKGPEVSRLFSRWTKTIQKGFWTVVKNRWAFWLDSIQAKLGNTQEDVWVQFDGFWDSLRLEFGSIQSPRETKFNYLICRLSSELVQLGHVFECGGLWAKAEQVLSRAVEMDPYFNWIPNYYLGILLLRQEKTEAARRTFKASQQSLIRYRRHLEDTGRVMGFQMATHGGQTHLVQQLNNEMEVLEPHLLVLEDLLGHSFLDTSVILANKHVKGDEAEAVAIVDMLKNHLCHDVLKPLRFSKKVRVEGTEIVFDNGSLAADITGDPLVYQALLTVLRPLLNNGSAFNRQVHVDQIQIQTIGGLWNDLVDMGMITTISIEEDVEINYLFEYFDPLNFHPPDRKTRIGYALNIQHRPILQELSAAERQMLETAGILLPLTEFRGLVNPGWTDDTNVLSQALKAFINLLVRKESDGTAILVHREYTSAPRFEAETLITRLISQGIVKQPKIYWPFHTFRNKENERRKTIETLFNSPEFEQAIGPIYDKWYRTAKKEDGTEVKLVLKEYRKSICKTFIASAGKLKSTRRLCVEDGFLDITKKLPDGLHKAEVRDLQHENFDRVPLFYEGVSLWNTGAFVLSLLGVLQITAGVLLAVVTGGTATPIAALLISEGIGDLIFATQAGLTGNFSWKSYGINKSISVALSVATGGLSFPAGVSFATAITKNVAVEIFEKIVLIIGKEVLTAVGQTAVGLAIEKALDSLRAFILDQFKDRMQSYFVENEAYMEQIQSLRGTIHELFGASYTRTQAKDILNESIESLTRDNDTGYKAALETLVGGFITIGLSKLKFGCQTSKHGNFVVESLKILKVVYGLVKTALGAHTGIPQFMAEQVTRLNQYLRDEIDTLNVKRGNTNAATIDFEEEEIETDCNFYVENLHDKMVSDGLENFQQEFLEPTCKTAAFAAIQHGCNKAFKAVEGERLADLRALTDSLDRTNWAKGVAATLPQQTSRNRIEHSNYWLQYNPYINHQRLLNVDSTFQDLYTQFAQRVRISPAAGGVVAVYMWYRSRETPVEEVMRIRAQEMGLRVEEVIEF